MVKAGAIMSDNVPREKVKDTIMEAVDNFLERDHAELNITKHQNQIHINDTSKSKITVPK